MISRALALMLAAGALTAGLAHAQAYPAKPIRLVVISAPGGTTDILARALAQPMTEGLGQAVVTDNRPGGGGIMSSEIVAHANPDGYTLLYTHTSFSVLPSLHAKLPYDSIRDFQPVGRLAFFPGVLIVNNRVPIKSVKERAASQGAELAVDTPEQFAAHIQSEIAKWGKLVRASHMKVD